MAGAGPPVWTYFIAVPLLVLFVIWWIKNAN